MSFEEALGVLLGMVGQRATVLVRSRGVDQPTVAFMRGVLQRTDPASIFFVDPGDETDQVVWLQLGDDGATGFRLTKGEFRDAHWASEDNDVVSIQIGDLELEIGPAAL